MAGISDIHGGGAIGRAGARVPRMGDYSSAEAAKRAGITPDELGQLVELGILHPAEGDRYSSGDIRKAALVHDMTEAGLPLEGLAAVITRGGMGLGFMDSPAYERFTALGDETFAQASERTGVPIELLMVVREAAGGSVPSPDDKIQESELPTIAFMEIQHKEGFRQEATERLLRVQGESLRRIAESEAAWWRSEVIERGFALGRTVDEIASERLTETISPATEASVQALYRAHQAREWTSNIIDGFEFVLNEAGYKSRVDTPPAMCFLDITGYTRLTDERGDEAAAAMAGDLTRLVQRSSSQHGGKAVKWLGDGVMFWFRDPGPGVVSALDMADGVLQAGLPPAHVGLHAGPVVRAGGDYYGQTVNIASRIAEYARPGEVLVSEAVVEACEHVAIDFTDLGPVDLKGVGGPVHLHAARRS
jgi:class 3 adenylate cyclase/DNA-binding transcriptional MerR regulator